MDRAEVAVLPTANSAYSELDSYIDASPIQPHEAAGRHLSFKEKLNAQLSRLASQHHTSEHNRAKYGPNGSPTTYIPLSIDSPDQYNKLQDEQARNALGKAWWPSQRHIIDCTDRIRPPNEYTNHLRTKGPIVSRPMSAVDLQEDLLNAISSPLTPQITIPTLLPSFPIKTSESHPINISMMIPIELLPIISSHLSKANQQSPVLFHIPQSFQLHRLLSFCPPRPPPRGWIPGIDVCPINLAPSIPSQRHAKTPGLVDLLWNPRLVREAVISKTSAVQRHSGKSTTSYSVSIASSVRKTSKLHRPLSPTNSNQPSFGLIPNISSTSRQSGPTDAPHQRTLRIFESEKRPVTFKGIYNIPIPPSNYTSILRNPQNSPYVEPRSSCESTPMRLGNLFLSSCPGKKVRLDGPSNGRAAVRRDVRLDLTRIREFGAGCVVCCLDDQELEFLGAPWDEYCRVADELGLDVLRLPTPEGLAPASVTTFDEHLTRLIDAYTLQGIPVLVHCRGGVGRAGLVACCWTLKLGLCGWIETQPDVQPQQQHTSRFSYIAPEDLPPLPPSETVRRDTLQLVERVISLVRRRRSLKVVETFEQVRFLVDYVEHLRGRVGRGVEVGSVMERDIRGPQTSWV